MFLNSPSLILDPLHHLVGMQVVGAAGRRQSPGRGEDEIQRSMHPGFCCVYLGLCYWSDSLFFPFALQSDWWFSETFCLSSFEQEGNLLH